MIIFNYTYAYAQGYTLITLMQITKLMLLEHPLTSSLINLVTLITLNIFLEHYYSLASSLLS